MADLLLGIDVGTQATKAILLDRSGQQTAVSHEEYQVDLPNLLWAEQWPEVWMQAVVTTIRRLIAESRIQPDRIAGVCISSLYGGSGIPLDGAMKPVRPCLIWMDRRATEQVERIKRDVDTDELLAITGNWVDSYFGFTKILWIRDREPSNWRRIRLFLPPSSYLVYRLTGEIMTDHSSAGNLAGVYDIRRRTWSDAAADLLELPLELLPRRLVPSGDIVGGVHSAASRLTGLPVGTPVLAGGVDAAMATLAAGAVGPGDSVAMMGSSTCWGVVQTEGHYSRDLVSMPHVEDAMKKVYAWAGSATSGATVKWFRDNLTCGPHSSGSSDRAVTYKELDQAASQIRPGCDGLVALPYFMGERAPVWDSGARGGLFGLTLAHTNAHVYRAFLEASGFSLRHAMEAAHSIGIDGSDAVTVVGGVARSPVWLQILADVTNRPIRTLATDGIGAPLGDAFLVARALGWEHEANGIVAWLRFSEPITPCRERLGLYDERYTVFRGLYEAMRSLTERGSNHGERRRN